MKKLFLLPLLFFQILGYSNYFFQFFYLLVYQELEGRLFFFALA